MSIKANSKLIKLKKIIRFISIYGFSRTFIKAVGRSKQLLFLKLPFQKIIPNTEVKNIGIIGCGQFSFSTISYFLKKQNRGFLLGAYDLDISKTTKLAKYYNGTVYENPNDLINNPLIETIYIASNHASHTEYAIEALKAHKKVYVEKPLSVNFDQFFALKSTLAATTGEIYCGYNRPHSEAIKRIAKSISGNLQPLSLNCFISGHVIGSDHWYRKSNEGTRICGNVGHWIDLAIHLMNKRGKIAEKIQITIAYSNNKTPDDDIAIAICSDFNDLINIVITSRTEPFEGINETINLQSGNVIAKIDDFRTLRVWEKDHLDFYKYLPKDVGHKSAVLQPFVKREQNRDWYEIETSTYLMLVISEMVKNLETTKTIELGIS